MPEYRLASGVAGVRFHRHSRAPIEALYLHCQLFTDVQATNSLQIIHKLGTSASADNKKTASGRDLIRH